MDEEKKVKVKRIVAWVPESSCDKYHAKCEQIYGSKREGATPLRRVISTIINMPLNHEIVITTRPKESGNTRKE